MGRSVPIPSVVLMDPEELSELDAYGVLAATTSTVRRRRLAEVEELELLAHWSLLHGDDPVHLGIPQDPPDETAAQRTSHPGHEHDLSQDQRLPLALPPTANLAGRRSPVVSTGHVK